VVAFNNKPNAKLYHITLRFKLFFCNLLRSRAEATAPNPLKRLNRREDLTTNISQEPGTEMPPCQLPTYTVELNKRGRSWSWSVSTEKGQVVMLGAESRRTFASYKANRALFLMLLCAPYSYVQRRNSDRRASSPLGRSRSSFNPT
jgi:hypothetical protein